MTASVKDSLSRVRVDTVSAREAEVTAVLRYANALHVIDNETVAISAELDRAAVARRLQSSIEQLFDCHAKLRVVPATAQRRTAGYLITVDNDARVLARRTGLLDRRGVPVRGIPPHIVRGTVADAESVWRGALQCCGRIVHNGRTTAVEVPCTGPESALALVGAARKLGVHAKMRVVQGADRVTVRGDEIGNLLFKIGGDETRSMWDEHIHRRHVDPGAKSAVAASAIASANLHRASQAAAEAIIRAQRALQILGPGVPPQLHDAGVLRIEHPHATLEELGQLADPPLSKDAVAGRIRRLIQLADRKARQLGLPDTETALTVTLRSAPSFRAVV
ncbi:DNA-binding protein WhiA [Mycolicibacterium goodii]|uniref:DNA-binding protein WhiA n=1 Tax=Mycolicibacterium goodii TaxID=134601 RepID=UPI0027E18234|nr:DNA-binding protein WhiA [Mycolicibacterium goodii]